MLFLAFLIVLLHTWIWLILLLKRCLLGVVMHSPSLTHSFLLSLFLCHLPFAGNGDEEHALLSHGVCQERGDIWWVIFSSITSAHSTNTVPPSSFASFPSNLHKKSLLCCISNALTNKEVSKSSWVCSGLRVISTLIAKATWSMQMRTISRRGPCHVPVVIAEQIALILFSCHIKWPHWSQWGSLKDIRWIYYCTRCRITVWSLVYCVDYWIHGKQLCPLTCTDSMLNVVCLNSQLKLLL